MKKILLTLTTLASLTIAGYAQSVEYIAHKTGLPVVMQNVSAYERGYRLALVYWSQGVTVTDRSDIEDTANVQAYRQEIPKRDTAAFIRGFYDATETLLHNGR